MTLREVEILLKKVFNSGTFKKQVKELVSIIIVVINKDSFFKKRKKEEVDFRKTMLNLLKEINENLVQLNNKTNEQNNID